MASKVCDIALFVLIVANVLAIILESLPETGATYRTWFEGFELFSVTVFASEYALRLWSCVGNASGNFRSHTLSRLRYVFTPMAMIDLVAILPFFLAMVGVDLRFLRVVRLLRLLKLTRYSNSLAMLLRVSKQEAKPIGASLFVLFIMLLLASSFAYIAEHKAQPEAFGSIPKAMWWAIITMTTIGYGDVTPITLAGKIIAASVGIIGIGMVALPAGLLASGFTAQLHHDPEDGPAGGGSLRRRSFLGMKGTAGYTPHPRSFGRRSEDRASDGRDSEGEQTCPHCGSHLSASNGGSGSSDTG